jgi:hypothetical protein
MGLIGDIFQGINGSNAATKAAGTQSDAAKQAQQLELQNQQHALDFQNGVWDTTQKNEQPYLQVGQTAANGLNQFLQTPFSQPTLADVQNSPGYQFQLQTGVDALDKSAAAKGNLFSGTQGTALEKFGTGLADSTYNDAYQRALGTYMTNYNTLMGGSQLGEHAAGTTGQLGQEAAGNTGQIDLTGGAQQAQQINNAAAARASGYVGSANAWNSAINNANSQMQQAAFLAMA